MSFLKRGRVVEKEDLLLLEADQIMHERLDEDDL
jgi:hypothetical protein